jgi:predicted esterase
LTNDRLIWIGANDAGNERGIGARVGLSLDAVENFRAQYNIDEMRIYAAGPSGGGKIASLLAIAYADVFSGAMPIAGVSFYRAIQLPGRNAHWDPMFERPPMLVMERAKTQNRFALLTGSDDFNRESIKETYDQGFTADGFKYVDYIEVPAMGHGVPEAKWVEQAIGSLDAPLPVLAKDRFNRAQQLERSGKTSDALKLYQLAEHHLDQPLRDKAKARIADLEKRQPKPTTQPRR